MPYVSEEGATTRKPGSSVVFNTIEPPSWSIFINYLVGMGITTGGFDK